MPQLDRLRQAALRKLEERAERDCRKLVAWLRGQKQPVEYANVPCPDKLPVDATPRDLLDAELRKSGVLLRGLALGWIKVNGNTQSEERYGFRQKDLIELTEAGRRVGVKSRPQPTAKQVPTILVGDAGARVKVWVKGEKPILLPPRLGYLLSALIQRKGTPISAKDVSPRNQRGPTSPDALKQLVVRLRNQLATLLLHDDILSEGIRFAHGEAWIEPSALAFRSARS